MFIVSAGNQIIFPGPYFDRLSIKKGVHLIFVTPVDNISIRLPLGVGVKADGNFSVQSERFEIGIPESEIHFFASLRYKNKFRNSCPFLSG